MRSVIFLCLASCLASVVIARRFSRCGLARELLNQGMPMRELPDWVCLIEGESERQTNVTNPYNDDGSTDYGLFQINNRYWCEEGRRGKGCNVSCQELLSDDISAAVRCAQLIKRSQGWSAWVAWNKNCQGQQLPDLSSCFSGGCY